MTSKKLKQLNIYIDSKRIIQVDGRTNYLATTHKDQALIPSGDIVQLMIRQTYKDGHLGLEYTLAQLRESKPA